MLQGKRRQRAAALRGYRPAKVLDTWWGVPPDAAAGARRPPPRRPAETTSGHPGQPSRLGARLAWSRAIGSAASRPLPQDSSQQAGDERPDGKKRPIAQLQDGQGARQRCGARRPAPFGQSTPDLDECCGARDNAPVACANMDPPHRLPPGYSFRSCGAGGGHASHHPGFGGFNSRPMSLSMPMATALDASRRRG